MKKIIIPHQIKPRFLATAIGLGALFIILLSLFIFDILRVRVINVDNTRRILAEQKQKENNYFGISKVAFQQGSNNKGLDLRCLTWSSKQLYNGWSDVSKDHDFFIDYYLPSGKKAIICTTPILAGALAANSQKRFLYEVSTTDLDDGLYVRIVIGLSEVRETCKLMIGSVDCMNSLLMRQAIVKYEP
ncbi:MAG: hypothetical protein IGS49_27450 [Chlorogloeopsis fritschii C42_A2020_084]|uniref:hypothetical protein n=1 Tax=Chlorogloeopsis fritschii TaxID=1124 RepID=UPI0019FFDFB3|nr:hypothetical protein [Chlorogloeopsis fritschii]MBF2009079.1 hypothetical protein [Chlorogloeopsis fritschii C42_A2020_084]